MMSTTTTTNEGLLAVQVKPGPRRIVRRRRRPDQEGATVDETLLAQVLDESSLPKAYNFEIHKCLARIMALRAAHVALQMPEGLLLYATVLADVFQRMVPTLTQVSILGDVTYGACCVDDLSARAMGAALLIHYGHSCLVPLQHSVIPCLYVFVELQFDVQHFVDCVVQTIPHTGMPLALLGTIQFRQGLVQAMALFAARGYTCTMPQAKPLSPGEVLGCTSPRVDPDATVLFCADGRFHLESTMISNPAVRLFLRYDPYSKTLTKEEYAHEEMHALRQHAIRAAQDKKVFGVVLGTLGRQGNPAILKQLQTLLQKHDKRYFILLLSELSPAKLNLMKRTVQVWVQIACPRLSVDWGHYFGTTPVLSPYELHVALGATEWKDVYPMDFYSDQGGPWANYHLANKTRQCDCTTHDEGCGSGGGNGTCMCLWVFRFHHSLRNIHSVGCLERKVAFAALTSTTIHDCATSIDTSNGLSILVLHVS